MSTSTEPGHPAASPRPAWVFWQRMSPRDRRAWTLLSAFLVVVAVYAGVWAPLGERLDAARSDVRAAQDLNLQLQAQGPALALRRSAASAGPPSARIAAAAASHGVDIAAAGDPSSGRGLVMEAASAQAILAALADLKAAGIPTRRLSLAPGPQGGWRADIDLAPTT